jgi:hypothetical protein
MVRVGAHAPKIGKGTVVVQGSLEWTVPTPHPKPRDAFLLRRCAEACPTTCGANADPAAPQRAEAPAPCWSICMLSVYRPYGYSAYVLESAAMAITPLSPPDRGTGRFFPSVGAALE